MAYTQLPPLEPKKLGLSSSASPLGLQIPIGRTAFTIAISFSMLLLLLFSTTGSNFFLETNLALLTPAHLQFFFYGRNPSPVPLHSGHKKNKKHRHESSQDWPLLLPSVSHYTQTYFTRLQHNGTLPCHHLPTATAHILGSMPKSFSTGSVLQLTLVSLDANGSRRCYGGDYYETDLSGPSWKSRPPILDHGNGTYSIWIQVHPNLGGPYHFKVILMFSNYHGLHRRPERWFRNETILDVDIEFIPTATTTDGVDITTPTTQASIMTMAFPENKPKALKQCKASDFQLDGWSGRWVRPKYNRTCSMNSKGRLKCLKPYENCVEPWCKGPLGLLESNGWVYSAHCSFRVFSQDLAWKCVNKKWLFFWGDSNHVDTIRNFLNFVLGFENITEVPRRFDATYSRPHDPSQYVRITSMFNGHSNVSLNHEGLFSLNDSAFQEQIRSYFTEDSSPDVIVMNSGLHDGMYWKYVQHFVEQGVTKAIEFWSSLLNNVKRPKPKVIYRTTIATAAWARKAAFNPQKMEMFNYMFVEKLKEAQLLWGVVDDFDLTYPWHYDTNCSDGVHYGKPPALANWYGQLGHQYFVDLMLVHILLHAICVGT